ncbi:MAG: hypothetical protein GX091_03735 [Peptococcaceae bacterium]|nr:hypothetical protein [Peptococcaceae bacterium]
MTELAQLSAGSFNHKNNKFYRQMLAIALPVMIQNFLSSLLNLIDTVMVGRLGEVEIAAVGIDVVYGLTVIEEIAKCFLSLLRLKSGRWIKNVTRNLTA